MKEYKHGGDIYRNKIEYDFSVNVNPLGMPERVIHAACEGICASQTYPDYRAEALTQKLAACKQIEEDSLVFGNGAAELIYALCHGLRPRKVLMLSPTFSEYAQAASAVSAEVVWIQSQGFDQMDAQANLERVMQAITKDTDLVFFCNPNNPTGTIYTRKQILRLLGAVEKVNAYLCVDECFLPFVEEDAYSVLQECCGHRRLIVLRAFTKIYAMAGLRLGYMVLADETLRQKIYDNLQPWNTSVPAQQAGLAALEETAYVEKTRALIEKEKQYLLQALAPFTIRIYEGAANFIFLQAKPEIGKALLKKNILIRDCESFEGLSDGYFRIAVRSHEENEKLVETWRTLWQKQL